MRRMRHRRPPWWPEEESWPPADREQIWRHRRGRFIGRFMLLFAVVLMLSGLGIASLLSRIFAMTNPGGGISRTVVLAFAGLFLWLLFISVLRRFGFPLGNIVSAANRVAEGDFSTRIPEYGPSSLRTVGRAFNTMASRLEEQDRQRRNLMAEIAHELRTPLSVIQGRLEGLLDGIYARDDVQIVQVLEETRLVSRLVDDLRTLANAESGMLTLHREPTDIGMLIQDAVNAMSAEAAERRVTLRIDAGKDLPLVEIDPLRIREVLLNLLSNALQHTPEERTVSISARLQDHAIFVAVVDEGSGIAPEDLPRIFDRFHKGSASRGSGLGLTIAKSFVTAHGGSISAQSRPGEGACVTFTLPLH